MNRFQNFDLEILEEIIQRRKKKGLTQQQLADKVGISRVYLSRIENGQVEPSRILFRKIMLTLGISAEVYSRFDTDNMSDEEAMYYELRMEMQEYLEGIIDEEDLTEYIEMSEYANQLYAAIERNRRLAKSREIFDVWDELSDEDREILQKIANSLAQTSK